MDDAAEREVRAAEDGWTVDAGFVWQPSERSDGGSVSCGGRQSPQKAR
jgi:hypothetical protein